jgi:predicted metal-dependent hydrolase
VTVAARIIQGGRSKAYRPMPARDREQAIRAGLEAYREGEFFDAHELLEPAWMATADLPERDALQGLIKLAAAYVHAVRGNPRGVVKNLDGANERLRRAIAGGAVTVEHVDLVALATEMDRVRAAVVALGQDRLDPATILSAAPPPVLASP